MYSLNENALEKSAQFPKHLKSLGSGRKPLILELEDEMFCYNYEMAAYFAKII